MKKYLLIWMIILLAAFVLGWVFLKIVSVKETKVISTQETSDILNTPAADKILNTITGLANQNYDKKEAFYENLSENSEDKAIRENQTETGEDY